MNLTYGRLPNLMLIFAPNNKVTVLSLVLNFILLPLASYIFVALTGILTPTSIEAQLVTYIAFICLAVISSALLSLIPRSRLEDVKRAYLHFTFMTLSPILGWLILINYFNS